MSKSLNSCSLNRIQTIKSVQSIVINLGSGDLKQGFSRVTAQLWTTEHPYPEQFIGSLPPFIELAESYRIWQSMYKAFCGRLVMFSRSYEEDDELEIDEGGITHVSQLRFDEICQQLEKNINTWLSSAGFFNIERQLRSQLNPTAEIRVIVETNDEEMRRLPWSRWDFFKDYPYSEIALSKPEYKRRQPLKSSLPRQKVRILAILGNSKNIDLNQETRFLNSLLDAETTFLVKPSRVQLDAQLWDNQGWDILFFAGHSQTQGETGRIYINENHSNNSLTIQQLEESLNAAINYGLKLAIFNSCDGLGLAKALEKLNIPQVIVMREPVPNRIAQEFFQHFLTAFAIERMSLYLSVRQARRKLQALEDEYPGASWLPVICQNPAVESPTWLQLGGIPPSPYRGLFSFREEDRHLFFGREKFTENLVAAVEKKPLVAVVGSSGSGKSSVVFAGLIPRLREDVNVQWQIISFRPGKKPFEALARAIAPLWQRSEKHLGENTQVQNRDLIEWKITQALKQNDETLSNIIKTLVQQPPTRFVLIVDQFEELYSLSPENERQSFVDGLLKAVKLASAFTLVITLRADFYGYALSYRPLSDALQGAIQNLGPMNDAELQSAIEKPAAQMQVRLEKGLTNQLINQVGKQPGSLPLLEFALTQLWSKQRNGILTYQAYSEIGGMETALARHAETIYTQLKEANRQRVQQVFMQLMRLGEKTEAIRRVANRDEVKEENWDLVRHLASARLVVTNYNEFTGEETVEIVHEALIRGWGRLEHWMQVDGEFRRWQEQLRAIRYQWESSDGDQELLLRGKPLVDAEYWHSQRLQELSAKERYFIELSLKVRDREAKKQKRRRELTTLGLISGLVGALILTGTAWLQWQNSLISEIKAISLSSEALFVSNQNLDALIEALRAKQKLKKLVKQDTSTQAIVELVLDQAIYGLVEYNRWLAQSDGVRGIVISPNDQMIVSIHENTTLKLWSLDGKLIKTLEGHSAGVTGVAFSPDGQTIASASEDTTVKLWNLDGSLVRTIHGHTTGVTGVAFSPDGQIIASASEDTTVKLWSLDGRLIKTLKGHSAGVTGVAFSPDGQTIASASEDTTVKLWSLDGRLIKTLEEHGDIVWGVAFSSSNKTIVSASWDGTIRLWSYKSPLLTVLSGHSAGITGITFSPDGQTIASASDDNTIKLWNLDGTLLKTLKGHSSRVYGIAFSPDGQTIASASNDNTVKLWNLDGTLLKTLKGHDAAVWYVVFSPDGHTIASGSGDKMVKLWNLDGTLRTTLVGHKGTIFDIVFSPDGHTIASGSGDKMVKLWNLDGTLLKTFKGHSQAISGLDISFDGRTIASASHDNTIKLWNLDGTLLQTLKNHKDVVEDLVFSPDGQLIVSVSADKTIKLWNRRQGTLLKTFKGHTGAVWGVDFRPDGKRIASVSADQKVIVWNLEKLLTLDALKYSCNQIRDYLHNSTEVKTSDRNLCDL